MKNVSDFVLSIELLSDAQYKKLFGSIPRNPATETSPSTVNKDEAYAKLMDATSEHDYGVSVEFISIGVLLERLVDTPVQAPIQPGKVLDVLLGDYGLLKGFHLIKPFTIGERDVDVRLLGGRHRLMAFITYLTIAGFTEDEIKQQEIPCFVINDDELLVLADNTSRGATTNEKLRYRASSLGIDVESPEDIVTKYVEGKFPSTPATNVGLLFKLLFLVGTSDYTGITDETKIQVMSAVLTEFKKQQPYAYKTFAAGKLLNLAFMSQFLAKVIDALPDAVDKVKASGVTIIAREPKAIALNILTSVNAAIKSSDKEVKLVLPIEPVKEKATKEKTPKPSENATKKKTTKKTKKSDEPSNGNGATVIPEATVPPSSEVKVIVSQ